MCAGHARPRGDGLLEPSHITEVQRALLVLGPLDCALLPRFPEATLYRGILMAMLKILVAALVVACSQAYLLAPCASSPPNTQVIITAQLAELRLSRGQERLEIEGAHLTVFQHRL